MQDRINKKNLTYAIIISLGVLIVAGSIFYFYRQKELPQVLEKKEKTKEEIIEQQLKDLDELRKQASKSYTKEELGQQMKELNSFRQKLQSKQFSEEEIKRQMEELNKLR